MYIPVMATYTATARSVNRTCETVGRKCTSTVVTKKARTTIRPLSVKKFSGDGTLSRDSSPLTTSLPFSTHHTNFIVTSKTNVIILRRCRRTMTHKTGVCTRMYNCNGAYSTRRCATPHPSNAARTGTFCRTLSRTRCYPRSLLRVGARNANAPLGSGTRATTVGVTLNRSRTHHTVLYSAGSVANRTLKTTKNVRTITTVLTLSGRVIPPAVKCGRFSPSYSLSIGPGRTHRTGVAVTLSSSLKFNKRGTILTFEE